MADTTEFRSKLEILADLWLEYRDDEAFKELFEYSDLGFPLAYAIANGIVESNSIAEQFIEETYNLLLATLGVEDTGFESLNDLLEIAEGTTEG